MHIISCCASEYDIMNDSRVHVLFQIIDIINENEAHFLSSLQQGTRLIHRTLRKMEDKDSSVFPGQGRVQFFVL